jgi:hypothetical protein
MYFLCLYILIVMFGLFCIFVSILPTGKFRLPWLRFFRVFSSVVKQMPGHNSQKRGTAHTLPKLIVLFCVLFVCKCVLCPATGCHPNCNLQIYQHSKIKLKIQSQTPPVFLSKLSFNSCPKTAPLRRSMKLMYTRNPKSKRRKHAQKYSGRGFILYIM